MRKIDLTDYKIKVLGPEGEIERDYDTQLSLIALLFHPELKLGFKELLDRDDLARKLRDAAKGPVLLEDADYRILRNSLEAFHGYTQNEVELVRRVIDAPVVKVQEAA